MKSFQLIGEKRLVLLGRNRLDHFEDLIWFRVEREQGLVLRNEYLLGRKSGGVEDWAVNHLYDSWTAWDREKDDSLGG